MKYLGRRFVISVLLCGLLFEAAGVSSSAAATRKPEYTPQHVSLSPVEGPGLGAAIAHAGDIALGLTPGKSATTDTPTGPSPAVVDGSVANVATTRTSPNITQAPAGPTPSSKADIPQAGATPSAITESAAPKAGPVPKGTTGRAMTGFDIERSVEDPTGRDAYTTTYLNPDGTETVRLSSVPVHYLDAKGAWQKIDNRVVVGEKGVLTNAGNDWHVTFGPMVPGQGVTIDTADGQIRFVADGANAVQPTVEPDGTSVRYKDVFGSTDLVYKVLGGSVEELLIVKSPAGRAAATFTVEGAQFDKQGPNMSARGTDRLARRVHLSAPESFDGKGRPIDLASQVFTTADAGAGQSKVTVGVTKEFLASLQSDLFPLTVDPSVGVTVGNSFVQSYAVYSNTGGSYASYNDGYVRVGNPYLSSTSKVRWRSVAAIDYSAYLWSSVVDASLTTTVVDGTASGSQGFDVYWADQYGFHYSVAPRVSSSYSPPTIAYTNSWTAYLSSTVSSGTANHAGSGIYQLFNNFTRTGSAGGSLLFRAYEAGPFTYKKMAITVNLTINRWPSTPSLWNAPTSGHTLTWGAASAGTDPDNDPIYYNHYVYSGGTLIYQTGWVGSRTTTWTTPSQYRGGTLAFGTQQWDGVCVASECHVTGSGTGTWTNVGNLAPQPGSLSSPVSGAQIHPSSVTAPTVTFTGTVGSDTAPEVDSISYAFFYCPNSNCTTGGTGPVFLQGWQSSTAGAAVSLANVAFSTSQYGQTLYWGLATGDGVATTFSALRSFVLVNTAPPEATGFVNPTSGSFTPDVTPTLTVTAVADVNADPVSYTFRICNQQTWTTDTTKCIESAPTAATAGQAAWTVPAVNPLKWGQPNYWWLKTSDGVLYTESGTKAWLIPRRTPANTPAIGFGVQPNMRGVADVNPATGNLTYAAHDLSVQALGGPLELVRAYNSASTTVAGFGSGWTSTWEYTLTDAAAGLSVRRPDGSVLFFGRNGDGTLAAAFADGSTIATNPTPPAGITTPAWGVTDHDRTVVYFNSIGGFLGAKDINGRVTTMTTVGNTQTVTDLASGRQMFIDWNATPAASTSRITATRTTPLAAYGNTAIQWRYFYDANNRLAQACDPRNNTQTTGNCTLYTYDTNGQLATVVLPKGNTQLAVTYLNGKVDTRKDGYGKSWSFAYATNVSFTNLQGQQVVAARRTTVTDPLAHQDIYDYDVGIRVMHYDNLGGLADFVTYDSNGFIDIQSEDNTVSSLAADTFTVDDNFDPDGDLVQEIDPEGDVWAATFDLATNSMVSETTPASPATQVPQIVTTITLDATATGQPALIATPGEPTETILYTGTNTPVPGTPTVFQPANLPKQQSDTAGNLQTMDYNAAGDLIKTTTNSGVVTTYTYDEIGRRLTETITAPTATSTSTYTYNQLGQTATDTASRIQNAVSGQWHQARTSTFYDANTNPTQVSISDIEPAANGFTPDATRTTIAEYDLNDRNWRNTDPEGNITSVTFDDVGNQTTQTDALGRVTQTVYDTEYRPIQVIAKGFADPTNPTTPRDITLTATTYDGVGRVDTETDANGNVTKYTYAASGQIINKKLIGFIPRTGTPFDVTLEAYTYDEAGRIKSETTANGTHQTTNTYDTAGRLATQTLTNTVSGFVSPNRTTTYTYDTASRLITTDITDGSIALQKRTGYDTYGRATTQTIENGATDLTTTTHFNELSQADWTQDPNGNKTYTDYDVAGRPTKTTAPSITINVYGQSATSAAPTAFVGYNTFGDTTHQKDPASNITTTSYDRNGHQTIIQQPAYTPPGTTTPITPSETVHYDPVGNIDYRVDRRGQRTDYTYDTLNRQATQTDPAANTGDTRGVTQTRYDDTGNITWIQNPVGAITRHTYDKLARTRTTTETVRNATATPDQYTTTYDYDWADHETLLIDPTGTTVQTAVYSPAGDLLATTDALGKMTVNTYNPASLQLTSTDPEGRSNRNTYDQAGRTTATGRYNNAGTKVIGQSFSYDNNGNQTAVTDNLSHTSNYTYDSLNRLATVTQPVNVSANIVTSYGYDTRGLQTRMTDGNGHDWWTTYNSWGLEESRIEPDPTTPTTFTRSYDAAGTLYREDQPGGVTITHTIDNLGRDKADDGGIAGGTRGFTYDRIGQPTTITSGTTSINLAYNDRAQLVSATGSAGNSNFTYDPAGRMTHRVDAAGDTGYAWNARNQLASLADPVTGSTHTYTYSNAGDLTLDTITNGTNTLNRTYTYTSIGQPATDTLTNGATTSLGTAYTYDANGNLQTKTITPATTLSAGTNTYTYDWAARLANWTPPTGPAVAYTYDNNGNLTQNGATTNSYNWHNQQLTNGTTINTWTQRGTLATTITAGTTTNYTFDGLNRMTVAGSAGYSYDGFDRLVARNAVPFTYSGDLRRPSTDGVSTMSTSPAGTLIAASQSGTAVSVALDRHTDVTATFASNGSLADSTLFDPWGHVLSHSGAIQISAGFQSDYADTATGLVKMGARWYQTSGSFVSEDSFGGELKAPGSTNRYAYGLDSPTNFVDPTGRSGNSLAAAVGLVAHRAIEDRYLALHGGAKREEAYKYHGYKGHAPLRVDLVDPYQHYYYEIKPNTSSGRASGRSQLKMREVDRRRPWTYRSDHGWVLEKGKAQFMESIFENLGPATLHIWTHRDVDGLIVYDWQIEKRATSWGDHKLTDTLLRVLLNQYANWINRGRKGPKPLAPSPPPDPPKVHINAPPAPDPALVKGVQIGAVIVSIGAICLEYCWILLL